MGTPTHASAAVTRTERSPWSPDLVGHFPARTLEDVCVNHEAVIFRRGRIYPESFVEGSTGAKHYHRGDRYAWFLLKNYWLRRGAITVPSGLWAIDNYSPDSYHHWIIDVLPRTVEAETSNPHEHTLLLPAYYRRQAYIPFTLRAFPRLKRVAWIPARSKTLVRRLAFVPRQPPERMAHHLGEIAARVSAVAGPPDTAERIYFSRADAQRRRARNEADLVRVLRAHDFGIINIDSQQPWKQVAASSGARLIAGVHGAALTNLIFMRPGGQVLEFRHGQDDVFSDHYRPLAEMMGMTYLAQICRVAEGAQGPAINHSDVNVDLDLLRENLARLGARESSLPRAEAG